jgi:thiosulfate dehydrogenase [quinone] large subunit
MATTTTPADAGHDRAVAALLLRLALGLDITLHGVTRLFIGGLTAFVNSSSAPFQHSALPIGFVRAFLTVVPFVELPLGILLMLGVGLSWTLALGAVLMIALEFGTAIRSDWTVVSSQLLYSLLYSALLFWRSYDIFSVDGMRNRRFR